VSVTALLVDQTVGILLFQVSCCIERRLILAVHFVMQCILWNQPGCEQKQRQFVKMHHWVLHKQHGVDCRRG
jgi:hypothetical protein